MRFVPKGISDAFDATEKFMGACLSLVNLIFDQSNPEVVISRPGVTEITDFSGFTTPGAVSVAVTVGTRTYGLLSTARNAGKDEPFSYDHATGAFDTVTGVTAANSPTTQATTGAWTPPTAAVVGSNVVFTHPGFSGGSIKFGVMDISTVGSPTWTATDTTTNGLTDIPVAVANFNNRAYFAVRNMLEYTDVLSLTRTLSSQALTIGDTSSVLAVSGLPVQTSSSGIVQALIAFKDFQVWQVTGDAATSNLAQNFLSLTAGCSAPRSIVSSPRGVYFASIGGPYIVNTLGAVMPVTHSGQESEQDIVAPFQNAITPSRIAAGYSGGVYRVSLETVIRGSQDKRDYWFDERRNRWNGPHTFNYDCASAFGNYFVIVSNDDPGLLIKSEIIPSSGSVYTDLDAATTGTMETATFPKTGRMTEKQVVESTLELSSAGAATSYMVTAYNDQLDTLSATQIAVSASGVAWGAFVWGDGTRYASATNRPRVYNVPWTAPLVFKKMAITIIAAANAALCIGAFFARFQDTGYTVNYP